MWTFFLRRKFPRAKLERGQSTVELAMVVPLLLLIAAGAIEFGRAYYLYNTLSKSVREAARYMSQSAFGNAEKNNCRLLAVYGNSAGTGNPILPGLATGNIQIESLDGNHVPVTATPSAPPIWVKVSVSYPFTSNILGLIPLSMNFTPAMEMRYVGLNARFCDPCS